MKKIREWISIKIVKSPRSVVLLCVLVANVAFIGVAAFVISWLAPEPLESGGFWNSVFNTIIMYLGIGGIDTIIEDISQTDALLVFSSIVIVLIGLVFFTYALIGYMSEVISNFIGSADSSSREIHISNHTVILNWNTRGIEIVNDLLYKNTKEKIVILSSENRDDVLRDIDERLTDTIETENEALQDAVSNMGFLERRSYLRNNKMKNKLTIIAREGNTCSTKQLGDISIEQAKSVIVLSTGGGENSVDTHSIKTLIQVAQMMSYEEHTSNKQIVVEVEDEQMLSLVNKIAKHKIQNGKCTIVPISVNRILGYIFSQFSIMPELNIVYSTLFSYKNAELYALPIKENSLLETEFCSQFLDNHVKSIPLGTMRGGDKELNGYYLADSEQDIFSVQTAVVNPNFHVSLNPDFEIDERHVIILGHSSKNMAMMEGFANFNGEWKKKDGSEVLDVTIIDDESSLISQNYYKQYPWVKKIVSAEIYEQDLICDSIREFIETHGSGGCILILSDDTVATEEVDENALTYLVLVQDIIRNHVGNNPHFDLGDIDIIVEIVDPKNHDIVNHYNTRNVVVSNRYVSKMIMQVGENRALFDFYEDILTYDSETEEESKELYIKKADTFFKKIPEPCTAADLIRAIYLASPDDNKSIILGYFDSKGEMTLFSKDQSNINVVLSGDEKLILFSNH